MDVTDTRKQKRQTTVDKMRNLPPEDTTEEEVMSAQQVQEAAKSLGSKSVDRRSLLRNLRNTFGTEPSLVSHFLKINGSLQSLVGIMTGNDTELQIEALACLTNMAAGSDDDVDFVLKMATPYLVTYLSSSNYTLQDQCAWAVGNLVSDSESRSSHLMALGVPHLLIQLLQSPSPNVARSAAFSLANFSKFPNHISYLLKENLLQCVQPHLVAREENFSILTEVAWILFYIASRKEHLGQFIQTSIPEKLAECFTHIAASSVHSYQVLTPVLRGLASLCCVPDMAVRLLQSQDYQLLSHLGQVMTSAPEPHLRMEALWLLTNLAATSEGCNQILSAELVPRVVQSLASTPGIKLQACECLCNIASQSEECRDLVLRHGTLQSIVPLLSHGDIRVTQASLYLCQILLTHPESMSTFENCGGRFSLEQLTQHSDNQLCAMARDLCLLLYSP